MGIGKEYSMDEKYFVRNNGESVKEFINCVS